MKKLFMAAVLLFSIINTSFSQTKISGVIHDINTRREIRDVNVYIKGTNTGTITNRSGKYTLQITASQSKSSIIFQHISYEKLEISVDSLKQNPLVYMQPRVIQLPGIEVIGQNERQKIEISKDIPQTVALLDAKNFEIRGYVDAGDYLKTEHSVQVEEEISGKKTLSIRGGNADEVIVLYNGVKMNSSFDNLFDFSLIDLENLERFELIKGSNTALYGPEAFSGVINIVPEFERDYTVRAQHRIGTYNTQDTGINLYKNVGNLHAAYSYKQGEITRTYADAIDDNENIENNSKNQSINLGYYFSRSPNQIGTNKLHLMLMKTELDYDNHRDIESLSNSNDLYSLRYDGHIGPVHNLNVSLSWRNLVESQDLVNQSNTLDRDFDDESLQFFAEKRFLSQSIEFLTAYQYEQAKLNFTDERTDNLNNLNLQQADLKRDHHGFVAVAKFIGPTGSSFFQNFSLDASIRHDRLNDKPNNQLFLGEIDDSEDSELLSTPFANKEWQATKLKLGAILGGYKDNLSFQGYLNYGSNTKFPTLLQQISTPLLFSYAGTVSALEPEDITSLEIGFETTKEIRNDSPIYGWNVSGNYFQNMYDNKFRAFTTPGIPIVFYDNVATAEISGLEGQAGVFLFRKKVNVQVGLSRYFISEKSAFPFKSDFKRTLNFSVDHAGYSFLLHWFMENDQIGWIRNNEGGFSRISLEKFTNLDMHISKTLNVMGLKFFVNFTGRNLLNDDDVLLQGLAIRDRRFYLTVGSQI